jgi:hypothetical protein
MTAKEQKDYAQMWAALKRITHYASPSRLARMSDREYGLSGSEAIEGAYENVLAEAKDGIKGVGKPKSGTTKEKE